MPSDLGPNNTVRYLLYLARNVLIGSRLQTAIISSASNRFDPPDLCSFRSIGSNTSIY